MRQDDFEQMLFIARFRGQGRGRADDGTFWGNHATDLSDIQTLPLKSILECRFQWRHQAYLRLQRRPIIQMHPAMLQNHGLFEVMEQSMRWRALLRQCPDSRKRCDDCPPSVALVCGRRKTPSFPSILHFEFYIFNWLGRLPSLFSSGLQFLISWRYARSFTFLIVPTRVVENMTISWTEPILILLARQGVCVF